MVIEPAWEGPSSLLWYSDLRRGLTSLIGLPCRGLGMISVQVLCTSLMRAQISLDGNFASRVMGCAHDTSLS